MKFFKQLKLFILLGFLVLSSCNKDEIFTTEIETPIINPTETHVNGLLFRSATNTDGLEIGCVSVDYPFEMLLTDSTTIEITSMDDFIEAMENITIPPIDFVYPLNVTDQDENNQTVGNADELALLFADCIPDTGWGNDWPDWFFPAWVISYEYSCYQLVYPVTLLDMDSMDIIVNDEDELISYLADGNLYSFAFPLHLEDEAGNPVTAADPGELFDLLAECSPNPGPGGCDVGTFGCYQLEYPVTLKLVDGSTVVVNDDDEFAGVVMSGEWAGFGYPLTLIDDEGNEITVNDDEELNEALLDCGGIGSPEIGDFICYDFEYPFSVIDFMTSATITFNNSGEWNNYQFGTGNPFEFVYPLTITHVETSIVTTVNNDQELTDALEECF